MVSIIIPTYNRAALLKEAIESAIAQTYRPIECIIVDDGSIDNTRQVVAEMQKEIDKDFSIKYIEQLNSGSQEARNTGTAAAKGEFIQYLDSDDILYPVKISEQVKYLREHPDCDGVFGDWEKGELGNSEKIIAYKSDDLITQFLTKLCISNFSFLMRKSMINAIGDWDVNIKRNQEIDFHLRGVLAGGKFDYQSLNCGLWRTHSGERIANKANLFAPVKFYKKWENILSKQDLLTRKIKEGIVNNYIWFVGEYYKSPNKELENIIKETYRIMPYHPIFLTPKFKIIKNLLGIDIAIHFWVIRYKKGRIKVT